MSLPTDLTITICGPLNTDAQKIDYEDTYRHLAALDCHFKTITVLIPLQFSIARIIAVRATRDDFIIKHGLLSLKWDENVRKKDNHRAANLDDSSSTGSDVSGPCTINGSDQIGYAKIWAMKSETIKKVVDYIRSVTNGSSREIESCDGNDGNGISNGNDKRNVLITSDNLITPQDANHADTNHADANILSQRQFAKQSSLNLSKGPSSIFPTTYAGNETAYPPSASGSGSVSGSSSVSEYSSVHSHSTNTRDRIMIENDLLNSRLNSTLKSQSHSSSLSQFQLKQNEMIDSQSVTPDLTMNSKNWNSNRTSNTNTIPSYSNMVTSANGPIGYGGNAETIGDNRITFHDNSGLVPQGFGPTSTSDHVPVLESVSGFASVFNSGQNSGFGSRSLSETDSPSGYVPNVTNHYGNRSERGMPSPAIGSDKYHDMVDNLDSGMEKDFWFNIWELN